MLDSIKAIAENIDSAIVFFSTGKDSVVMLNLFHKYMQGRFKAIYLYIYKGLKIRENVLKYYEKQYKIKIDQYPQFDVSYMKRTKKLKQADIETFIRNKYNIQYLAYGYRKNESLERRGILKYVKNGIDEKYNKLYPVADWSEKDIFKYIKLNKLVLPIDYNYGFRDINIFKGNSLLWLYNNFREDYETIKKQYPLIEGELLRVKI